ncbi:hypothetical protein L7F22_030475 [Adiantum nelumboides]|nr:hypothetical protein [Adiantum nelumboides]
MAKSSAVKSPRQKLTPRRLLHSLLSAKASPSVDNRDEASDEAIANAVKATPPPTGKKPTPKRKKSTPKNLDNQEAEKRGTCMRRTRSLGFLDEGSIGSLAQSYPVKKPRGGATAFPGGLQAKQKVSFDTVEGFADAIANATIVDTYTNGIVNAMEVDAGTDAVAEVVYPSDAADDIVDAEEAKGIDATVEDMRSLGEEDLTKKVPGIGSVMGNGDVAAFANIAKAGDRAVQLREAMGEIVVAATDMKEANTNNTIESWKKNNEVGKGIEVPTNRAAQSREAMGEHFMVVVYMKEAVTHDTTESCTDPLLGIPKIFALPLASCEEKKRRDNLCIILDMNGLLIRRYKVPFYKGIARNNTLDWERSKYQIVTGQNVTGKMQFEYVVRPNASNFLDALLQRAEVALWSCMTQDNLALALSACYPRLNKQLFLDIIDQEGCREASFKLNEVLGIPISRDNAKPIFFKCLKDFWKHYTKFNSNNTLVVDDMLYKYEENKIEDEGDMSQATQQVLPTIDEENPFHKGDAMSTQEVVEHESDFVAQKPSNDMNKGSENMLPTIGETQIHEGNTRNSEEKMVVVENQSDVQTSPKPSNDMIIKDTYSMPLRDEEVEGSEKKDEANEEHQGALATVEAQDKVDKGTGEATRNANKAQSIQGRVQGTEGEEREIQERLRREEEEEERKILEHLRREEEEEERKILEHLRRQEEEEAQKKEEPAVHYKRPRRRKYLDPYFMDEL